MGSILLINAAGRETRVALVENGHIAEFYLERKKDKGVVGNISKASVVGVPPGMQAAFVDIGLDKAAFLYVSDVVYDPDFARAQFELTEGEHEDAPEVPDELEDNGATVTEPVVEAPSLHAEVVDVDATPTPCTKPATPRAGTRRRTPRPSRALRPDPSRGRTSRTTRRTPPRRPTRWTHSPPPTQRTSRTRPRQARHSRLLRERPTPRARRPPRSLTR